MKTTKRDAWWLVPAFLVCAALNALMGCGLTGGVSCVRNPDGTVSCQLEVHKHGEKP